MTENLNGELVPVRQQLEVDAEGMGRLAERLGTDCRAAGVHLTGEGWAVDGVDAAGLADRP